ncbi:MAG: hypothetical protein PHE89_07825 [Alphaproteobacteria bacterium]|nr:hypothetical protein [Alphaproteobacteria bacterium]
MPSKIFESLTLMEWSLVFKSLFSLMFVLGLMLVCVWAIKYFQANVSKNSFLKKIKPKQRIKVLENKRIDIKNSVVLLEVDEVEYAVLLSPTNALVLNKSSVLNKDIIDEI